jgi:NAD(P)-dependent dehydrogenase (short-subunit alcohol dehydrogenase family)
MGKTRALTGQVTVVAGATRGAGRGIARGLGEAGATVYCTGRSTRGNPSPYNRPETIEETAQMVTDLGGIGIPVRVDHTMEAEVAELVSRVLEERGRIDVLVNCVAGEDPSFRWNEKFWETDIEASIGLLKQTFYSHVITAKHVAPPMIKKRRGLIIEVTDRDSFGYGRMGFNHDLVKTSVMRLGHVIAEELRPKKITALSIMPGFLRSEAMLDHVGVTETNWRDGIKKDRYFAGSETPLYLGRGVAAIAADPDKMRWSGEAVTTGEVANHYGITDYDGRQPDIQEFFSEHLPADFFGEGELERGVAWHLRVVERVRRWLPKPKPRRPTRRSKAEPRTDKRRRRGRARAS